MRWNLVGKQEHAAVQLSLCPSATMFLRDSLEDRLSGLSSIGAPHGKKQLHGVCGDLNWDRSTPPNQHATHLVKYLKNYWADFNHFLTQPGVHPRPQHIQRWSLNSFCELRKSTFCVRIGNGRHVCLLMTSEAKCQDVLKQMTEKNSKFW